MADGRTLVAGEATGAALVLEEPLSFWGGLDPDTGRVIDVRHPQSGAEMAARVLVMPSGRGSSSSPSVLAEATRAGTAPAAIVMREPDPLVALGAIVARELYGNAIPVVVADEETYGSLRTGAVVTVRANEGTAEVRTQ